jgi:nitrate reductase gamma subunit
MAGEILLFKEYYCRNRSLWYFTYSLHLGLYLGILWLVLITCGAILIAAHVEVSAESASSLGYGIQLATMASGVLAFLLGAFGAIGLLAKRLTNEDLRLYSAPADYFNLLLLAVLFLSGLAAWYWADPTFSGIRHYVAHFLGLDPGRQMHPLLVLFWTVLCLFVLYMPFTPMMHFIGKYFMYHRVRWDDEPNVRGGNIEKRVQEMLAQQISWSGGHIKPGSTWGESALNLKDNDRERDTSKK